MYLLIVWVDGFDAAGHRLPRESLFHRRIVSGQRRAKEIALGIADEILRGVKSLKWVHEHEVDWYRGKSRDSLWSREGQYTFQVMPVECEPNESE